MLLLAPFDHEQPAEGCEFHCRLALRWLQYRGEIAVRVLRHRQREDQRIHVVVAPFPQFPQTHVRIPAGGDSS